MNDKKSKSLIETVFEKVFSRKPPQMKLGEILVREKLITQKQLDDALAIQKHTNQQLGDLLKKQGAITNDELYKQIVKQWKERGMVLALVVLISGGAQAGEGDVPPTLKSNFTFASAPAYPHLFGAPETKSDDISAFSKWTDAIARFESQMKDPEARNNPHVAAWRAALKDLRYKSEREKIEGVNAFLNKVRYVEDKQNYGVADYWATPVEFLTKGGDCEDYAIAKYASLRALGFSAAQLRIAVVEDEVKHVPHALLVAYTEDGSYVLDNQDKKVERMATVARYRPIFSLNSASWWLHS